MGQKEFPQAFKLELSQCAQPSLSKKPLKKEKKKNPQLLVNVLRCNYVRHITVQGSPGSASIQIRVKLPPTPLIETH